MSNARISGESTPEGRIAAIARVEMFRTVERFNRLPDYADFREAIRKQVQTEILLAQISEAKLTARNDARIDELVGLLADVAIRSEGE
jgi:hypothetical protein